MNVPRMLTADERLRGDAGAAIVYHARFLSLPVRGRRLAEYG
jgi:hypothetical protein